MNLLKKLAGTRSAVTSALDELDVIRSRNADLQADLRRISSAPLPVAQALEFFDQWAERISAEALTSLRPEKLLEAKSGPAGLALPFVTIRLPDGTPERIEKTAIETSFGLMVGVCLPALRSQVEERLETAMAGRQPLTMAERAEQIAKVEAELFAGEMMEEAIVRSVEQAGLDVQRRADASPAAVLASDASLPA